MPAEQLNDGKLRDVRTGSTGTTSTASSTSRSRVRQVRTFLRSPRLVAQGASGSRCWRGLRGDRVARFVISCLNRNRTPRCSSRDRPRGTPQYRRMTS